MSIFPHQNHCFRFLASGMLTAQVIVSPAKADETIYFVYSPFSFSLNVQSLEKFAQNGAIDAELAFYMNLVDVNEEEKQEFQAALLSTANIDPLLIYRFFNTDIGEDILARFGYVINIQGGRNGKYALRAALVKAALSREGLSLLNFLQKLPVDMQIDLNKSLKIAEQIETVVKATQVFTEEIANLSQQEAQKTAKVNYSQLPKLYQKGSITVKTQRWILTDASRDRTFFVDIYLPQTVTTPKIPVVVFSHGLASRPEDFARQAQHLASYGYLVAVPQHPGSDYQQFQALIEGYSRKIFVLEEFIDRPLDITYVIDELQRRNESEFMGKLALDRVGVFGHSFGGYTALAIAGATFDFDYLKQKCHLGNQAGNTSLLLQCQALKLEHKPYNFRDKRVAAVYASNPVNSAIFGPQGLGNINIPVFISAGNYDPATPFVYEQVISFPWLKTSNKYLLLQEGQAHVDFSQLDAGITDLIESTANITLPTPKLLDKYTNASLVAFFEVYIDNNPKYEQYLQSSYFAFLSLDQPFHAYLITPASSAKLNQAIEMFQEENKLQ